MNHKADNMSDKEYRAKVQTLRGFMKLVISNVECFSQTAIDLLAEPAVRRGDDFSFSFASSIESGWALAQEIPWSIELQRFFEDAHKCANYLNTSHDPSVILEGCRELQQRLTTINSLIEIIDLGYSDARKKAAVEPSKKPVGAIKLLETFAWFCGRLNRQIIECILGDLKKDVLTMRMEKRPEIFVQFVMMWHVCIKTIAPIVWDGLRRFLSAVFPVGTIIRKLIGF